jgi:hypothetical protein
MQTLRNAHLTARCVLLWFALFMGVAIASPWVQPQSLQVVCSGSGASKVVVGNPDGQTGVAPHALDCPLCAGIGAPPPLDIVAFTTAPPLGYALPLQGGTHRVPVAAAPPPARGPPTLG